MGLTPSDAVALFNEYGYLLNDKIHKINLILEKNRRIDAMDLVKYTTLATMEPNAQNKRTLSSWRNEQTSRVEAINQELNEKLTVFQKRRNSRRKKKTNTVFDKLKYVYKGKVK